MHRLHALKTTRAHAIVLLVLCLSLLLASGHAKAQEPSSPVVGEASLLGSLYRLSQHEATLRSAEKLLLPGQPPALFRSLFIIESRARPCRTSPAGAGGIGQVMPGTWRYIQQRPNDPANIRGKHVCNVPANIRAAAVYLQLQRNRFKHAAPGDREMLALASYNAGPGHLLKAVRWAKTTNYTAAAAQLPRITGKHSLETGNYVYRILATAHGIVRNLPNAASHTGPITSRRWLEIETYRADIGLQNIKTVLLAKAQQAANQPNSR